MRCPKCGFHSFDFLDACPKCNYDWRELKEQLGITAFKPQELNLLEDLLEKVSSTGRDEIFSSPVDSAVGPSMPEVETKSLLQTEHEEKSFPTESEVVEMDIESEVEEKLFGGGDIPHVAEESSFVPTESEAIFAELEKAQAELEEMEDSSKSSLEATQKMMSQTDVEDIDVLEDLEVDSTEETEEIEVLEDVEDKT